MPRCTILFLGKSIEIGNATSDNDANRRRKIWRGRADLGDTQFDFTVELENDNFTCKLIPPVAFTDAITSFSNKDFATAENLFGEAIAQHPRLFMEIYFNRGVSRMYLEKYSVAIEDFTNVISRQYELARSYRMRARCFEELRGDQNFRNSLSDLNDAIRFSKQRDATLYRDRARLNRKLSNDNEAISDLDTAIEIDPSYARAYYDRYTMKRERAGSSGKDDYSEDEKKAKELGYSKEDSH